MADYKIPFTEFQNVIDNRLSPTSKTRQAIDPSTEAPLWDSPVSTQEDVDRAVAAARTAFKSWRKLSQDERAAYLLKFADALEANKQEFIDLLGKEAGKPPQSGAFELQLSLGLARKTPTLRLEDEVAEDSDDRRAVVRYVPLGVGLGLVPWNFPITVGIGKMLFALLTGNTFIWKPSPYTPYSALKLAELGAKVFPPGVFQALSGEESLGPLLTAHPDIAKISFTGSIATGKKVMAAAASTLKRVTLELGGNDAAIVCEDVDIPSVVAKTATLAFAHTGQICMCIKRLYVHEKIYDEFLAAMVDFIKQMKVGDSQDQEAFFGPIQNKMQYDKLQEFYSHIDKEGWKTVLGGTPEPKSSKGYYIPPTIVDDPPEDSRLVVEEPFGPIVPVLKWSDEDDVVARANNSDMALGASVWSKDVDRAKRIVEQLEAGSIWVNTHFEIEAHMPYGGHKQSGFGMEWGQPGLKGWCNTQAYWIKHSS